MRYLSLGECIFLSLLLGAGLFWWLIQIDNFLPQGYSFCNDQGYDSTSLYGSYSEKYGKVNCVSCYDGECIYEEFNVTRKFGIIREAEGERT